MRKLLLLVVLVAACGGKKDKPAATDTPHDGAAAKPSTGKDGGGGAVATGKDGGAASKDGGAAVVAKKEPLIERKQVEAVMTAWLEAQNSGDFTAYSALYTDDFKGVRRSGKQTVRLDRAGWLKDRKKMFARPMIVAAREVEIVLGNGRATAKFMQEWSSGKYHDVGPKVIEVNAEGALLKISREELLVSKIVKTPKPKDLGETFPVYPVYAGRILLAAASDSGLDIELPTLIEGEVPERDPSCDDDPPDYEEDQDRYWECEASDPDRGHDEFAASASINRATLPKEVAAWIGQQVRIVGGDGPGCTATVAAIELYAEAEATYASMTADGRANLSIAEAVLTNGAAIVATLTGGCEGDWAQLASAPAATAWDIGGPDADIVNAVHAKLRASGLDDYDLQDVDVEVITSPDGKDVLAYASRDAVECYGIAAVAVIYPLKGKKVGDALLDDPDLRLTAAVDTNGDGWPELVFFDGLATYDPDGETYDYVRLIEISDEISEECGE